ncbi:hypothetical protein BT93_H0833 [Corymbia citriodora subsp. variegata]|nr:hypothetical protein BT93_H0833 [Corymbia citriodora subsp. variegata]
MNQVRTDPDAPSPGEPSMRGVDSLVFRLAPVGKTYPHATGISRVLVVKLLQFITRTRVGRSKPPLQYSDFFRRAKPSKCSNRM